MHFSFTEEQQLFADSVQRFALAHLEKDALKRAHTVGYPFDVAKLLSAQGLMGIPRDELLRLTTAELYDTALRVMALVERPQVGGALFALAWTARKAARARARA